MSRLKFLENFIRNILDIFILFLKTFLDFRHFPAPGWAFCTINIIFGESRKYLFAAKAVHQSLIGRFWFMRYDFALSFDEAFLSSRFDVHLNKLKFKLLLLLSNFHSKAPGAQEFAHRVVFRLSRLNLMNTQCQILHHDHIFSYVFRYE